MATIINNPPSNVDPEGGVGSGVILGIVLVIVVIILFVVFGLPYLQSGSSTYTQPATTAGNTTVNVQVPPTTVVTPPNTTTTTR